MRFSNVNNGGDELSEIISNIPNEILVVGCLYKQPDLFVEYGHHTKSKYDFSDEAARFFYDIAEIIYTTRSEKINKTVVTTFVVEDSERFSQYKRFGGWDILSKWIDLAIVDNFKNYFQVLKKYSLLREYQRNGFNVEKIINHKRFESFSALDIYKLVRGKVDRINTVILSNEEAEKLNAKTTDTILQCLQAPDQGIPYPFQEWNEMFRGMRLGTMVAIGLLSNAGKSRLLFKLICYTALVQRQKVLVLLNEMQIHEMRYALITTVINNPEYEALHGIKLTKKEREITLGLYKDDEGNYISRKTDKDGNFTETFDEYISRLDSTSDEFRKIKAITAWIDEMSEGVIYAKDVTSSYDDASLKFEIRKACLVNGVQYVAYDTLKPYKDTIGDWSAFKTTATILSELSKELNICLLTTFQLTDDAQLIDPIDLTSNQIANCKQIIHLVDTMVVFAEVKKTNYGKYVYYVYDENWGSPSSKTLNQSKRYYICNTLKNRAGNKMKLLFEIQLDYNHWFSLGEVSRK